MVKKTNKNSIYAALDIGSSKIACAVGKINNENKMEILGFHFQPTKNVKKGLVINPNEITNEIISIINHISKKTNTEISNIIINANITNSKSKFLKGKVELNGEQIDDYHIRSAINNTEIYNINDDYKSLHEIINHFDTDIDKKILNPKNLYAKTLVVNIYQLIINNNYYKSTKNIIFNSNLNIVHLIASPFASSLSTLTEDEKLLGTICIDLGAGTTSVSIIENNKLIFADSISVGGNNITNDIVSGINTPMESAERLKTLYGSVFSNPSDEYELIDVPLLGSNNNQFKQINRSELNLLIKPRVEETLELIRQKLKEYNLHNKRYRRVVLTGGGSLLEGIDEYAKIIFDSQVRVSVPINIEIQNEKIKKPQFSVIFGLLLYIETLNQQNDDFLLQNKEKIQKKPIFGGFFSWLDQYI